MVSSSNSILSSSKRYDVSEKSDSPTKNINEPPSEGRVVNEKMFKKIALGLLVLLLGTSLLFQWRICTFLIEGMIMKSNTQPSALQLSAPSVGTPDSEYLNVAPKKETPRQVFVSYNFYTVNSNNKYKEGYKLRRIPSPYLRRLRKSYFNTLQGVDTPTSAKEIAERNLPTKKMKVTKVKLVVVPVPRVYLLPRTNSTRSSPRLNSVYKTTRPASTYLEPKTSPIDYPSNRRIVFRIPKYGKNYNQTIRIHCSPYPESRNLRTYSYPYEKQAPSYITPYQYSGPYQRRYYGYY